LVPGDEVAGPILFHWGLGREQKCVHPRLVSSMPRLATVTLERHCPVSRGLLQPDLPAQLLGPPAPTEYEALQWESPVRIPISVVQ
jgi:hypothetical protein